VDFDLLTLEVTLCLIMFSQELLILEQTDGGKIIQR